MSSQQSSFNLPEDLRFNISQFSDEAFPGLTDEYILQEIKNVTLTYNDIKLQAEAIDLPHLLRYTTHLDYFSLVSKMIDLRDSVRTHKHNWSKFIDSVRDPSNICILRYNNREIRYAISVRLELLTDRLDRCLEYVKSLPEGIAMRLGDNSCIIDLPEHSIDEFLQQLFLKNCDIDPMSSNRLIFNPLYPMNPVQNEMYSSIHNNQSSRNLTTTELLRVLRLERRRYDLIQSILRSQNIQGLNMDSNILSTIEYMLSIGITATTGFHRIHSSCTDTGTIAIRCNDSLLFCLETSMRRVDPDCIVSRNSIFIDRVKYHIVQLKSQVQKDIVDLMRYIQLIHDPVMMGRTLETYIESWR
uniref:Uncharacterized protein n=1 Tax=viral metagenome TaxID=1070528 RepID=A0A6C0BKZ6_9ZZZZ